MEEYKLLDTVLKRLDENFGDFTTKWKELLKGIEPNMDDDKMARLYMKLNHDGYVERHSFDKTIILIKQKGIDFIRDGGYTKQNRIKKRKELADKISDYSSILGKPIGLVIATIGWLKLAYDFYEKIFG